MRGDTEEGFDENPLAPRRNGFLIGHEAAEAALARAARAGRLPHAILIGGPRGIGKATLAYRLARWLLAGGAVAPEAGLFGPAPIEFGLAIDMEHPVARRIASGGHADLLTVERGWDRARKRLKGEIVGEDAGAVAGFLHLTSAEGGWRIVVIDSADEMNRTAANRLLKILEEPPRGALLLLVCHAPGRLLPTLRSRCRKLWLEPLAEAEVVQLLHRYRPELAAADAAALALLAEGSIGRALDLADAGGLTLYRSLIQLMETLPALDFVAVHRLSDQLARGADDAYGSFTEMLLDFIQRLVAGAAGQAAREALPGEAALLDRLARNARLDRWIEVWENLTILFQRAEAVTLDRKQVVLDAFFAVEAVLR
jgi:DNA polymerase-3 subunit delta'